jgi:DnaK suppressor protein
MKTPKANNRASPKPVGEVRRASRSSKPRSRQKSRLTPTALEDFRQRLLDKRRELIGDVRGLRSEAANRTGSGSNSMPIHMAERGSDTWEQGLTLRLTETQASILRDIDLALQRIQDGTYGVCEAGREQIPKMRLRAVPWAKYCIQCASQHEANLVALSRCKHKEETEAK